MPVIGCSVGSGVGSDIGSGVGCVVGWKIGSGIGVGIGAVTGAGVLPWPRLQRWRSACFPTKTLPTSVSSPVSVSRSDPATPSFAEERPVNLYRSLFSIVISVDACGGVEVIHRLAQSLLYEGQKE